MSWVFSLNAQQLKVNLTTPTKVEDDVTSFHRYGNYLYSDKVNWGKMQFAFTANLKKVTYGIELTQYDENLKEFKKLSIDDNKKDLGPFRPLVHYGEDAIYVMYFRFKDEDKMKMFVSKVDPKNMTVVNTKEIMEYDQRNMGLFGALKTIDDTEVFYTVSKNGKNVWIVNASPKLIGSTVIDGDLNIVQKAELIPVKLDKLTITGSYIGNDGNKVLAYQYDNPENPDFYARGLYFQPVNGKPAFVKVKLPNGYYPGNLTLQPSKKGDKLYIGGQYYKDDYTGGGKGVLLGEVNVSSQSMTTPTFYPFTQELKQRVYDLDFASKKKGELIFRDLKQNYGITEMENGTLVMSADMHITIEGTKASYNFRGPVIHVFIKPDGKATMTLIPKKQASSPYTSFFNYTFKDKLICVYADLLKFQKKDFADKDIDLIREADFMVPVANVYDSEGNLLERKVLVDDTKKLKGNVMISNRAKIGDNKFLFPIGEQKVSMVKYYTRVNHLCYLEIL